MSETFWLVPAAMVIAGVLAAFGLVAVDRGGLLAGPPGQPLALRRRRHRGPDPPRGGRVLNHRGRRDGVLDHDRGALARGGPDGALSPGINDPHTAISVIDRLGAALCDLVGSHLPGGVWERGGRVVLVAPRVDYDGLLDAMFHDPADASTSVAVLGRMLEVLAAVASSERDPARLVGLRRHADLVLADAERSVANAGDLADLRRRYVVFTHVAAQGSPGPPR